MHYSERCLRLVQQSSGSATTGWVTLPVRDEGRRRADALLRESGIDDRTCLVGFHTTSSAASAPFFRKREPRLRRLWPAQSYAQLARLLHQHARNAPFPLRIIIDVMPEERRLVEPVVKQSEGMITVISAPPDFERYKAILQRMDLLVTPDTGPMHIAAAVGTPLVRSRVCLPSLPRASSAPVSDSCLLWAADKGRMGRNRPAKIKPSIASLQSAGARAFADTPSKSNLWSPRGV
jgi:ADP-heptose:LPS heptosyltransferase